MQSHRPTSVDVALVTLTFSPALGAFDDEPLRHALANRDVIAVRDHFFVVHGLPHLLLCMITRPTPNGSAALNTRPRPTPVAAEHAPLFADLRAWRTDRAQTDGVPPYVVFSNRELAAIVAARPTSKQALLQISGIGPQKAERYGAEILERVKATAATEPR